MRNLNNRIIPLLEFIQYTRYLNVYDLQQKWWLKYNFPDIQNKLLGQVYEPASGYWGCSKYNNGTCVAYNTYISTPARYTDVNGYVEVQQTKDTTLPARNPLFSSNSSFNLKSLLDTITIKPSADEFAKLIVASRIKYADKVGMEWVRSTLNDFYNSGIV
jgi:hypothetical protein